jgi:ATP-dependent Clp protease protease subunit
MSAVAAVLAIGSGCDRPEPARAVVDLAGVSPDLKERMLTLEERMLTDRVVLLGMPIDSTVAEKLIDQLLFLQDRDPDAEITIYVNTPGGVASSAVAIHDTIEGLSCPVSTVCLGHAQSGGALVLAAGTRGRRRALPSCRVMIHDVASEHAQPAEFAHMSREIQARMARLTGQPLETIERDTLRETWMSAEEAKQYGIVDHVVPPP